MVFPLAALTLARQTTVSGEMVLLEAIKATTAISQNSFTSIQVRHRTTISRGMRLLTEHTNWLFWGTGNKGTCGLDCGHDEGLVKQSRWLSHVRPALVRRFPGGCPCPGCRFSSGSKDHIKERFSDARFRPCNLFRALARRITSDFSESKHSCHFSIIRT